MIVFEFCRSAFTGKGGHVGSSTRGQEHKIVFPNRYIIGGISGADRKPRGDQLEGASDIFERGGKKKAEIDEETVRSLHAKIGELAVANDFLSRKLKPWTGK